MCVSTHREEVSRVQVARPGNGLLSKDTTGGQELVHRSRIQVCRISKILREEDFYITRRRGRTKGKGDTVNTTTKNLELGGSECGDQ